jgi:hypothetical protein
MSTNAARPRRFPPVSGPYGWVGAALILLALAGQGVAILVLVWLAFSKDLSLALPWIIVLLASFPLGAAGVALWRIGWKRTGTLSPSPMPAERRNRLLTAMAVMSLGSVFGAGGFLYLAFALEGTRRLAFAAAALFLGTSIMEIGLRKMNDIMGRPPPSLLGWSPKRAWVYVALPLVLGGLSFVAGLFWTDLTPIFQ